MDSKTDMPALRQIFADGYAPDMVMALIGAIEACGRVMALDGTASTVDVDNIMSLTWMLKAILADNYHIDVAMAAG